MKAKYTANWGVQIAGMIFQTRSSMIFYFNSQRQPAGNKINHICGFGVARVYYDITSHNGKNHTYGLFYSQRASFLPAANLRKSQRFYRFLFRCLICRIDSKYHTDSSGECYSEPDNAHRKGKCHRGYDFSSDKYDQPG